MYVWPTSVSNKGETERKTENDLDKEKGYLISYHKNSSDFINFNPLLAEYVDFPIIIIITKKFNCEKNYEKS